MGFSFVPAETKLDDILGNALRGEALAKERRWSSLSVPIDGRRGITESSSGAGRTLQARRPTCAVVPADVRSTQVGAKMKKERQAFVATTIIGKPNF